VACVEVREVGCWRGIKGVKADLNRLYLQLGVGHSDLYAMSLECMFLMGKLWSGRFTSIKNI
jgi:hypothetical protein